MRLCALACSNSWDSVFQALFYSFLEELCAIFLWGLMSGSSSSLLSFSDWTRLGMISSASLLRDLSAKLIYYSYWLTTL